MSWDQIPLGYCVTEVKKKNTGGREDNLLSLSYGNIVRRDIATADGLLPESFDSYNVINPGDTVLRLTDLQNDQRSLRVGLVEEVEHPFALQSCVCTRIQGVQRCVLG